MLKLNFETKNKILIRYSEIFLKGNNKGIFEKLLFNNIKKSLDEFNGVLKKIQGRLIYEEYDQINEPQIIQKLRCVPGIFSISVATCFESDIDKMCVVATQKCKKNGTFKIQTRRADKTFKLSSVDVSRTVGAYVLSQIPALKVDVVSPQFAVDIEIREDGNSYVYTDTIRCCGGLPVGCSGNGLLMLSGGIDSPVAGYMMAKRGMNLCGLHFHSYPYTSENAKEKVVKLSKIIKRFTGNFALNVVPFTEIQNAIHENCNEEFMVILMRRMMMRIANKVCEKANFDAIITGENLAQVASQTIQSITVTNMIAEKPVMRPLIGFDKLDIIEIARQIGTYETSILPYEDCCTIFLPKNPIIKPKIEKVLKEEQHLDIEALVENAVQNIEKIVL